MTLDYTIMAVLVVQYDRMLGAPENPHPGMSASLHWSNLLLSLRLIDSTETPRVLAPTRWPGVSIISPEASARQFQE